MIAWPTDERVRVARERAEAAYDSALAQHVSAADHTQPTWGLPRKAALERSKHAGKAAPTRALASNVQRRR